MKPNLKTVMLILAGAFLVAGAFSLTWAGKESSRDPWIGVYTQEIDKDLQEAFDLSRNEGALVVDVVDDSPADEAGLRRKDIIVKFNGKDVDDPDDLIGLVEDTKIGDKAEVVFIRKGKEQKAEIEVARRPRHDYDVITYGPGKKYSKSRSYYFSGRSDAYIGVAIQDLNDQLGDYFGIKNGEGILVTEVFEDSPAEKAGIKAGDVIIRADNEEVARTSDLRDIIADHEEGDTIEIEFIRRGDKQSLKVEIEEDPYGSNAFMSPLRNMKLPNLPNLPNMKWYGFDSWDDDDFLHDYQFDREEYEDRMDEMRDEMDRLRDELEELKTKLE